MIHFIYKTFDELTSIELHDMYALRSEVFVVEQDCVYQDIDGNDPKSIHVLGSINGNLVAYARILDQGLSYTDYSSIGRIVVSPAYRAQKLGYELVYFAIKTTQKEYANSPIKISAQAHLEKFYEVHQFKATGEAYLEDGIPHIGMLLEA
jgi:ElaA protein